MYPTLNLIVPSAWQQLSDERQDGSHLIYYRATRKFWPFCLGVSQNCRNFAAKYAFFNTRQAITS